MLGVPAAEVFPSSTGIIGVRLPDDKIRVKLPELLGSRSDKLARCRQFRPCNYDDRYSTEDRVGAISGWIERCVENARCCESCDLLGIAKGAGMIHPQLATMLVYIFTDLEASARDLQPRLREACDESLNCMSIDGDTSTNDTVLLLASGASGIRITDAGVGKKLLAALNTVCQSLAEQIVSDGEGVQHVIRLHVTGARSREEALTVARTIAHSLLVKTAWAGADPNWGRILAAVGRCGLEIDPTRVNVFIADQKVCSGGVAFAFNQRRAHQALARPECDVKVDLGRGRESISFLTTDLTAEYVRINADYST